MNVITTSLSAEALRRVLMHPTGGVVGLVDELLTTCRDHGLELDWRADRCRVCSIDGVWEELIEIPFRKSVVRAVLARFAALCNERTPNSVSPYGGQGEVGAGANPETVFTISFVNTPAEQKLELRQMSSTHCANQWVKAGGAEQVVQNCQTKKTGNSTA